MKKGGEKERKRGEKRRKREEKRENLMKHHIFVSFKFTNTLENHGWRDI